MPYQRDLEAKCEIRVDISPFSVAQLDGVS